MPAINWKTNLIIIFYINWSLIFIAKVNHQIYIASITENDVKNWAQSISRDLSSFSTIGSFSDQFHDIYQSAFNNQSIIYETIDPNKMVVDYSIRVLKKLSSIENSLRLLSTGLKSSYKASRNLPKLNESDIMNQRLFVENHQYPSSLKINDFISPSIEIDLNHSYIQIPTNYHYNDDPVEYEIRFTKEMDLIAPQLFDNNMFIYQLKFGGFNGLLRIYPGRIFKRLDAADTFDARRRNWFVNSVTPPKDIIFVIDVSGSMVGVRMAMANLISWIMLDLLNEMDYVAIIYCFGISDQYRSTFIGPSNQLIQANKQNIQLLKTSLHNYAKNFNPYGVCHAAQSITMAFETLKNMNNKSCRQIIVLITDGIETDVSFDNITQFYNSDKTVSILTYQVESIDSRTVSQMKSLSSGNNGCYQIVETLSECWNVLENFYLVISYDYAVRLVEKLTWSYSFQSYTTDNLLVSCSLALYKDFQGILSDAGLIGVAGVDMCLHHLSSEIPFHQLLSGSYMFMSTTSSILLFHPRLIASQIKGDQIQVTIKDFEFSTNSTFINKMVESLNSQSVVQVNGFHLFIDEFNRTHVINATYYIKNINQFSVILFKPESIMELLNMNISMNYINNLINTINQHSYNVSISRWNFIDVYTKNPNRCSGITQTTVNQLINCSLLLNNSICDYKAVLNTLFAINAINQVVDTYLSINQTNPNSIHSDSINSIYIHSAFGASWSTFSNETFENGRYAITLANIHLNYQNYSLIVSTDHNKNQISLSNPIYLNERFVVGVTGITVQSSIISSKILSSIPSSIALSLNYNTSYFILNKDLNIIDSNKVDKININLNDYLPNIVDDLLKNNICKSYNIGTPYGSCENCFFTVSSITDMIGNWLLYKSLYPTLFGYLITSFIITGQFYFPIISDRYSCRYDRTVFECSLSSFNNYYEAKIGCSNSRVDYHIASIPSTNMLLLVVNECYPNSKSTESHPLTCKIVETTQRPQENCANVLKPPINQCHN